MAKFLIGVLVGILLCVFGVVLIVALIASFGGKPPSIAQDSTLVLDLSGDIVERNPVNVPALLALHRGLKPTLKDVHDLLQKAAVDKRVNAVVLKPHELSTGWGKTQEILADLEEFKKSKKPLIAFLQVASARDYYLATAADRIYVAPQGLLDVKGFRAEALYLKDTLGKLGIEANFERIGKYKDAPETLTNNRMSDATREVLNSVLDTALDDFLGVVARGRKMTPKQVRAAIDQGPFLPQKAVQAGLADAMMYEDQVFDDVKRLTKTKSIKKLKPEAYSRVTMESLGLAGGSRVAVVYAVGDILAGEDDISPFGGGPSVGADTISRVLHDVGEDKNIKGVILRIDSPGGDAFASDQIWREVNLLHSKKPMVISMSDLAASGGYQIALSGDPILAYPSTFTGSIGVFFGKFNLRGLYDKIGAKKEILSRGKNAEIESDYHGFTPAEREKMMEFMNEVYDDFVNKVAQARKRKPEEVELVAQGRVWLGVQAKENGLVDELGGFDRAIALVKQRAKLRPEDKVTLVSYPPEKKLLDILVSRFGGGGEEAAWDAVRRYFGTDAAAVAHWRAVLKGGLLKVAPYVVSVQ